MKMLRPATTAAALAPKAMASRYLIGSWCQRVISYPVTQAPHCLQRGPLERAVDLVAQCADVDVDDPGVAVEGEVPDVLNQRGPGEHVAWPAHEVLQQRELGRGELDHAAAPRHLVPGRIEEQIPNAKHRGAFCGRPAHQGPQAGQELIQ